MVAFASPFLLEPAAWCSFVTASLSYLFCDLEKGMAASVRLHQQQLKINKL
jgi:hypothetical protein